jgi:hypothetical protein
MSHKNDPDYHDVRAKILLEAAQELDRYAEENHGSRGSQGHNPNIYNGVMEAATELRRLASNARREHAKVRDRKRRASRTSADVLLSVAQKGGISPIDQD